MTSAWTKEEDPGVGGSVVDRFYQGLLALTEDATRLVGKRYDAQWTETRSEVEQAREAARQALGIKKYNDAFEAAANQTSQTPQSPVWSAAGNAAVALAARKAIPPEQFGVLVQPLSVAMPWLRAAAER